MLTQNKKKYNKKIELGWKPNDSVTNKAGLGLLNNVCEKLGIFDFLEDKLPKSESWNGYSPSVYVKSIMMTMINGGQYIEDVKKLSLYQFALKPISNNFLKSLSASLF